MQWAVELASGSAAAVVSRLLIAPLDVVKIRMQIGAVGRLEQAGGRAGDPPWRLRSPLVWRALQRMVAEEGWRALWKGNWAAELMVLPYGAIAFLSYQLTKQSLTSLSTRGPQPFSSSSSPSSLSPAALLSPSLIPLLSGAVSGVSATVATYPLDLLRTRFAAQHSLRPLRYSSIQQAVRVIVRSDGLLGLYHGLWPTLVGIVPMMAIQFHTYEHCKGVLRQRNRSRLSAASTPSSRSSPPPLSSPSLSPLQQSACGFIAGMVSKLATMPLDVIKKRSQVRAFDYHRDQQQQTVTPHQHSGAGAGSSGGGGGGGGGGRRAQQPAWGVLRMAHSIWQQEGVAGLFRGSVPSLIKAGPYAASMYFTYELTKAQLQSRWGRIEEHSQSPQQRQPH